MKLKKKFPQYGPITIGEYFIYNPPNGDKIYIEHISGEGGEYNLNDLIKVIKMFVQKNF